MDYVVVPILPLDLEELRRSGRRRVDPDGGQALRCCLRYSEPGDELVLASYSPPGGSGPYVEHGPVFVHAEPCAGHGDGSYPEALTDRRQVFRAYGHDGTITDAVLVEPGDHDDALRDLFARPEVALVQSRNVLFGCFSFTVHRAPEEGA